MPLESAMDAVRALVLSIKQESVLLGEPGDRTAVSVEETIRREYERWMVVSDGEPGDDGGEDSEAGGAKRYPPGPNL